MDFRYGKSKKLRLAIGIIRKLDKSFNGLELVHQNYIQFTLPYQYSNNSLKEKHQFILITSKYKNR